MMKTIKIILGVVSLFLLVGCTTNGNDDAADQEEEANDYQEEAVEADGIWGELQVIERTNSFGEVLGERALVEVDRDLMTDEKLLAFHYEHIYGSDFNWFTVDFGDGTGYVFHGARTSFIYAVLSESGTTSDDYPWKGSGGLSHSAAGTVEFTPLHHIMAPEDPTFEELTVWADEHGIELEYHDYRGQQIEGPFEIEFLYMPWFYEDRDVFRVRIRPVEWVDN